MGDLVIIRGATEPYPVQTIHRGGLSLPAYAPTDTFTAYVYRGQDQPPLFAPSVGFWTKGGTQTGYEQGQLLVTITAAQSATLEAGATYYLHIWWSQQTAPVASLTLDVEPAAGDATRTVEPYCTYQDMLFYADWIRMVQRRDIDQADFYIQRLEARRWLDKLIIGAYSGSGAVPFGDPMYPASSWSGGGMGGRSPITSIWIRDALAAGALMIRPEVVRATAYKAISFIGLGQLGGTQFQGQGQYFSSQADHEALDMTAELDTTGSGFASIAIPLNSAQAFFR